MTRKPFGLDLVGLAGASALVLCALPAMAQTPSPALSGKIMSQAEGAMEGVVVNAKRAGSTITISVVSDAKGEYRFPQGRLEPGAYSLTIRAVGYDLSAPATVDITGKSAAHLDINLKKTAHLAAQLSDAEWLMSMPGTAKEKDALGQNCVSCHTLQRVVSSTHDAAEMAKVVQRMGNHTNNSSPTHPFAFPETAARMSKPPKKGQADFGAFIATINLSSTDKWAYALKTLPRPQGKATQVIYTTYDLPRPDAAPHDTEMDGQGNIWYSDFQSPFIGKLDPKTGKVTEYRIPISRPLDKGFPTGGLQVAFDDAGNVYEATMGQGQVVRLDPKTGKMEVWKSPDSNIPDLHVTMLDPRFATENGTVWVNEAGVKPGNTAYELDVKTGHWSRVDVAKGDPPAYAYGIAADSHDDAYGMGMGYNNIWRIDAKTLKTSYFPIPTLGAGGRRGHVDAQDRLWWAEFRGNGLGMFDPKTEKITEWKVPTAYVFPYDAAFDGKTYLWTAGMDSDLALRLNTKTGEFTEYLLPGETNVRHVEVQSSGDLSSLWLGDQHGGKIIHIQPLTP